MTAERARELTLRIREEYGPAPDYPQDQTVTDPALVALLELLDDEANNRIGGTTP
jgi:hypothetical protein